MSDHEKEKLQESQGQYDLLESLKSLDDDVPAPVVTEISQTKSEPNLSSILFLEDDPTISQGACMILENCGFRVEHYDKGADGLLALEREDAHFDIILCDYHLTDMDATEFIQSLVARGIDKKCVLATGSLDHADSIAPIEAYIEEILEKPISYFTVARRLHAILGNEDIQVPDFSV